MSKKNLNQKLLLFKEDFDGMLNDFLDQKKNQISHISPTASTIFYEIKKFAGNGGKRFRPALAYYTNFACVFESDKNKQVSENNIFTICLALEVFHTYGLIHDDILDKATIRRNADTVEESYRKNFSKFVKNKTKITDHALNAAIIAGDFVHFLADELMSSLDLDLDLKQQIINIYYQMQIEVHAGQAEDSFGLGIKSLEDIQEKDIFQMIDYKSGRYSIQKPILLAATLAGFEEEKINILKQIGLDLGLVFQIKDDILGIFGDAKTIGKSTLSDLQEGKKTIVLLRTYNSSQPSDKQRIQQMIDTGKVEDKDLQWFRKLAKKNKVLVELETFCDELIKKSQNSLMQVFSKQNPGAEFLVDLAGYLLERKY